MSHSFGIADLDATNTRYLDASGNKLHASYTAGATAPTKLQTHGISFDGGDLLSGSCQGMFNQSSFFMAFLFSPSFAANDGLSHYLFDTSNGSRYFILKSDVNSLLLRLGNTNVITVLLASFQDYWRVNQFNTIIGTGTSGDNYLYLNRYLVGTSNTAWAAANPDAYYIGASYVPGNYYAGQMYNIDTGSFRMTKIQADDWAIRAMQRVNAI